MNQRVQLQWKRRSHQSNEIVQMYALCSRDLRCTNIWYPHILKIILTNFHAALFSYFHIFLCQSVNSELFWNLLYHNFYYSNQSYHVFFLCYICSGFFWSFDFFWGGGGGGDYFCLLQIKVNVCIGLFCFFFAIFIQDILWHTHTNVFSSFYFFFFNLEI